MVNTVDAKPKQSELGLDNIKSDQEAVRDIVLAMESQSEEIWRPLVRTDLDSKRDFPELGDKKAFMLFLERSGNGNRLLLRSRELQRSDNLDEVLGEIEERVKANMENSVITTLRTGTLTRQIGSNGKPELREVRNFRDKDSNRIIGSTQALEKVMEASFPKLGFYPQ